VKEVNEKKQQLLPENQIVIAADDFYSQNDISAGCGAEEEDIPTDDRNAPLKL